MERVLGSAGTLILVAVGLAVAVGRYDDIRFLFIARGRLRRGDDRPRAPALLAPARPRPRAAPLPARPEDPPREAAPEPLLGDARVPRDARASSLAVLGVTVVSQVLRVVAIWLCGEAVGADVSPVVYVILGPLLFLVQMIPFTLNGLGVREAFFVVFLGRFDVPEDVAFAAGFLFYAVSIATSLPGALHPPLEERAARGAGPPVKVVFLTTSYPRGDDDFAGRFAAELAERLRGRGVEVEVVAPGTSGTTASPTGPG